MRIPILNIPIVGKNTVLSSYDARHKVPLLISIGHTLLVDDTLRRGREVTPDSIQTLLNLRDLIEGDGSPCIALHTALSLADAQIAAELLRQNLRREEYITNLYDGRKLFQLTIDN